MPNLLKLHEAIAVVLLSKENRTASIQQIADEINNRKLYIRRDNTILPPYQVMQRTKLSSGKYHHLFEYLNDDMVMLKNV